MARKTNTNVSGGESSSNFTPPLAANNHLVKLLAPQGSGNFLCVDGVSEERLVEINGRLKRVKGLIITRGDYAIISLHPTTEKENQGRLVGEIIHILDKVEIKEWKKFGQWPESFDKPTPSQIQQQQTDEEVEEEEDLDNDRDQDQE